VTPATPATLDAWKSEWVAHLDAEFEAAKTYRPEKPDWLEGRWKGLRTERGTAVTDTGVTRDTLARVGAALTSRPEGFRVHATVQRFLDARRKVLDDGAGVDWSTAEALALGSLGPPATRRLRGGASALAIATKSSVAIWPSLP